MRSFDVKSVPKKESAASESLLGRNEKIRCRAYELYLEHNRGDGYDVEDWLEAEAEINVQEAAANASAA
jgi:hypothetical protein